MPHIYFNKTQTTIRAVPRNTWLTPGKEVHATTVNSVGSSMGDEAYLAKIHFTLIS